MARMQIRRIGVLSAAKIYAIVMAAIALVIMIPVALIMMVAGAAAMSNSGAAGGFGLGVGLFGIILAPIMYGVMGFVIGALFALVYNVAAGFVGGVEMDLENAVTDYAAPPPPSQPWTQPPYQTPGEQRPY